MVATRSIAVIGAGPSGLFFCHAIETIMKKTGQEVKVTCFERSSQPGGVWRAADPNSTKDTTDMYDQLWTNGASHATEFFDYTFDEHFGGPVSVYMKRQDLLGYVLGRVKKNCPDFFQKYVEFNKDVVHVAYDKSKSQFDVTVKDLNTSQSEQRHFDKCVWACGDNGKQFMPEGLVRMFLDGGFQGRLIHSADTARLQEDVCGKRILLVGGGYSAEDLALQAIKLGVEKVYVSSRNIENEICYTKTWPMDKVEVLHNQAPSGVIENGRCIQFQEVDWTPTGYDKYSDDIETELRGIDTVILCTGYSVNLEMLHPDLQKGFPKSGYGPDYKFPVPENWTMTKNPFTELVGEVEPSKTIHYLPGYLHPEFFRGVLISNPNMMFITAYNSYIPLLACEAHAWLLAGYSTGWVELPSEDEMRRFNEQETLAMLDLPYFRYMMDDNYFKAVDGLSNFWPEDGLSTPELWDDAVWEEEVLLMKWLAQVLQDGKYPFSLGTRHELNKNAETMMNFGDLSYYHRNKLDPDEDEKKWKTFRDYDNADQFYSLFTGTKAIPLEQRWLEMDVPEETRR